ncbi:uncharacterized protein [Nicotiana tomentosiformis]|uniref:uncharacterized protein n=1 Tax=Nicotiana tomentosiformis TaxID=4098 RepID=UPI00051B1A2F
MSYANRKVHDVAFLEGEKVLLRVLLLNGMRRFRKKGKMSPRYIGSFEVMERVGDVAYRIALPSNLWGVRPVFSVSMLWKYHEDQSHVLNFSSVQLDENLTYEEEPVAILEKQVRKLRLKDIAPVKVQWRGQSFEADLGDRA